jgi:hypothetical protein
MTLCIFLYTGIVRWTLHIPAPALIYSRESGIQIAVGKLTGGRT